MIYLKSDVKSFMKRKINIGSLPNQIDFQLVKWLSYINEAMKSIIETVEFMPAYEKLFDELGIKYSKIVALAISTEVN